MKPFETILAETYPDLLRFCRGIARSRSDADDLAQTTCLRALEKAHMFEPGSNMRAWLFTIAKRLWIDQRRRGVRFPHVDVEEPAAVAALPPQLPAQEDVVLVGEIGQRFDGLSDDQKVVIYGIARGNSYERIAEVMQVPLGTVRSKLFRARRVLEGAA